MDVRRYLALLSLTAFAFSTPGCDNKSSTASPTPAAASAPIQHPAWSYDPWANISLPKPTAGTVAPLPAMLKLRKSINWTQDFIWESDKQVLLDKLADIHTLMDSAPNFAPISGLTIQAKGDWQFDGVDSPTQGGFFSDLSRIVITLLDHHTDLKDEQSRLRAQNYALAIIRLGEQIQAMPCSHDAARLVHFTGTGSISNGFEILSRLDKADNGNRLTKPIEEIEAELTTASKAEATRRSAARDAAEKR